MVCVLSKKQQKAFQERILMDIWANIKAGTPFELKAYMLDIYNRVLKATDSPDRAIAYTAMVPEYLMRGFGPVAEMRDYIITSIAQINEQAKAYAADPMNVVSFLGLDPVKDQKDLEADIKSLNEKKDAADKEDEKRSNIAKASISIRPYTFDSTTGDETDPDLMFSYAFLKNVLNNGQTDSQDTGYYVTLMSSKEALQGITVNNKSYTSGVLQVITDVNGNILYFNNDYQPVSKEEGAPVFFRLREKRDTVQTTKELMFTQNFTTEEAEEYIEIQRVNVKKKKDFVLAAPGRKVVQSITGGSYGYIPDEDSYTDLSTAEDMSENPLKRTNQFKAFSRGAYKDVVPFKMNSVDSDQEFLEDAINILLGENLVDERGKKSPETLLVYREKFFQVYFGNNYENVFFGKKTKTRGKLYVMFADGKKLDKPVIATRENLRDALVNNIVKDNKTGEMVPVLHAYNVYSKDGETTPSYQKNTDGTITLKGNGTSPVQYRKWLQNNSKTLKPFDSTTGKFQDLNGYFIFETMKELEGEGVTEQKVKTEKEVTTSGTITYSTTEKLRELHNEGKLLYTMRVSEKQAASEKLKFKGLTPNKHFGNPFTGTDVKGTIPMEDISAAVDAYEKWLDGQNVFTDKNGELHDLSDIADRRAWINSQIDRLKLKGGAQLGYFKGGYRSHADVLNERINGTEAVVETAQAEPSTTNNPTEYTNHSGGALGADSMFDTIGKEYGQTNHKHYYYGSKTPKGNVLLTEEQVKEGIAEMDKAAVILGRKPSKQSTINLLARNWFQVKNSTQVVAIAPIDESMKFVEGGTGWAVAMAQANGKEINVFNLKDNSWYKWNGTSFVKSAVPVLAKNFAGIGSRQDKGKMTPASIKAIRNVYDNTFNQPATQAPAEVKPAVSRPVFQAKTFNKPSAASREIKKINDKDTLNKLKSQGIINESITEEQINAAKEWYDSHPMRLFVPYEVMFNIINTENPNSIATFSRAGIVLSRAGIVLYKGSNFADLYHEAWHAFTQMFLTEAQRKKLYKELSNKSGTFKAFDGTTVTFKDATSKQLEEYLAEDFRQFMLNGGKFKGADKEPVKKSIFKSILDFLKAVFNISNDTIYNDEKVSNLLEEVYTKLRLGDINPIPYGLENSEFTKLDKIKAVNPDEQDLLDEMGYAQAMKIVNAIDAVFSQIVDKVSKEHGVSYAASLFSDPARRTAAYNEVIAEFVTKYTELSDKLVNMSTDDVGYEKLYKSVKTLELAITNFAPASTLGQELTQDDVISAIQKDSGILGFHLKKSKYLQFDETYDLINNLEEEDPDSKTVKDKDGYSHKSGNEISMRELAAKEVLYTIRSLYKYEGGKLQYDDFGFPQLNDFDVSWNKIQKALSGSMGVEDIYKKLQASKDKVMQHLLEKLGNPDAQTGIENDLTAESIAQNALWTNFTQTFTATRIPLIQLTVNFQMDDNGNYILEPKPGKAQGDLNRIAKAWEVNFSRPYKEGERKYIVTKKVDRGEGKTSFTSNYLNVSEVLRDFKDSYKTKPIDFLRSLGMDVSAVPEIQNALRTNLRVLVNGLWTRLNHINNNNKDKKIFINSIKDLINIKIDGKTEDNSYKELLALESRYSDLYGTGMVYNASGDGQFEFSKNGTFTVQINSLNAAKGYNELISDPKMSHLDYERNPAMRNNLILKALFGENLGAKIKQETPGGRETFARIELINSSGVSVTIDNEFANIGIATSDADEITNLLQNFYTTLIYGTPATTQHSDKSSAYLYKIVFPSGKKNYVNIFKFAQYNSDKDIDLTAGNLETLSHFMTFLDSEIQRMVKLRNGDEAGLVTVGDDLYKNIGDKFVTFKDILSPKTKARLEKGKFISENFLEKINSAKSTNLRRDIEADILAYFNNIVGEFKKDGAKFGLQKNQKLMRSVRDLFLNSEELPLSLYDKENESYLDEAIFRSFVLNDWIHKHETGNLFYGDVALYNLKKEDYHKRNAAFAATGEIMRTDNAMLNMLNNVASKYSYADSEWFSKSGYNKNGAKVFKRTMNTAVLQDTKSKSSLMDHYKDAVIKAERKRLGDKYEEKRDVFESNINKLFSEYGKMKEGDGQGWISFDSYRAMLMSLGKWSPPQEQLYRRILRNEKVDTATVLKFFPVKKMQYYGPLKTNGLPVVGFHKFSLMPLIPNVIEGSNLEILHNRMVEQNIDYALFQSASKVSTITSNGVVDQFYLDNSRASNEVAFAQPGFKFTNNEIFTDYFKDQTEVHDKFKGTILFSTQLRKLVEEGLMEQGVPTSFRNDLPEKKKKELWESLSESEKLKDPNYNKLIAYESLIKKHIDFKIKELKKEMALHFKDGKLVMSQKLIDFIKKELERQDLAEHEIDFIKFSEFSNSLVYDLSIHPSAETIEKLLVAIVNKRVVKQKINGEALVQVSGAGFEKANIRKATAEENRIYDDVGLPTYELGPDGIIRGMKVKIALQGDFKKLLKLKEVTILMKAKTGRTRLQALNMLIKDEAWLNEGDNRKLITMAGVRIPVQGLNHMEFAEVYEFLPEAAGNMIILPREIVAKAGSDFDIDKLFMMFPSLVKTSKGISLVKYKEGSEDTIDKETAYQQLFDLYRQREEAFQNVIDYTQDKMNEFPDELKSDFQDTVKQYKDAIRNAKNNLQDAFERQEQPDPSLYVELNELSLELEDLYATASKKFRDYKNDLVNPIQDKIDALTLDIAGASAKGIENDLLFSLVDILSMEQNFSDLITPNSTEYVKTIADDISKYTRDYDPYKNFTTGREDVISGTRIYELGYNRYKQASNNIGKKTLGLGAVDNTYNTLFNRVGAYMVRTAEIGSKKNPYDIIQQIRMPHNTISINDEDVISLSNIYDVEGKYRISTLISQMMNGWVDVAKDAWIFDINGNKEVSPTLLFMVQAGVPLEQAIYFAAQPIVRKYVEEQRKAKSTFAKPLNREPSSPNMYRVETRSRMIKELLPEDFYNNYFEPYVITEKGKILGSKFDSNYIKKTIYTEFVPTFLNNTGEYETSAPDFSANTLKKTLDGSSTKLQDLQVLLHFIELEEMSSATTQVKLSMNFDTQRSSTLRSVRESLAKTLALKTDNRFPNEILEKLEKESPIGAFKIHDEIINLIGGMFILRDHPSLNKLIDEMTNIYPDAFTEKYGHIFKDTEALTNAIRNDFTNYVFQSWLIDPNRFDPKAPYNNLGIDFEVKKVLDLERGAFVEGNTLYVDERALNDHVKEDLYSSENYWLKQALSPVSPMYLHGNTEAEKKAKYYRFVYERETLRATVPYDNYKNTPDFEERKNAILISGILDDYSNAANFEKIVGRRAYEDYIRDLALLNNLNVQFMFKDVNSYATQVDKLTMDHKNLLTDYKVLSSLLFTNIRGVRNLKLSEIKLTADEVNIYHDELERLADPRIMKVEDPFENARISKIFAAFPFFAFFQAGQGSKNRYSLSRLISTKVYSEMLSEASALAIKKLDASKDFIDTYKTKFNNLYAKEKSNEFGLEEEEVEAKLFTALYMKDYSLGESDENLEAPLPKAASMGSSYYDPNVNLYNIHPAAKSETLVKYITSKSKANNNLVFAFDDSLQPYSTKYLPVNTGARKNGYNGTTLFGSMLAKSELSKEQAVGLITKPVAVVMGPEELFRDSDAQQHANNIKRIDAWIEKLKSLRDDEKKTIIFNLKGHGQAFLGYGRNEFTDHAESKITKDPVALDSFVYLSERLYKEFGYINPMYKTVDKKSYSETVLSSQPITDEMVKEKLRQCFYS